MRIKKLKKAADKESNTYPPSKKSSNVEFANENETKNLGEMAFFNRKFRGTAFLRTVTRNRSKAMGTTRAVKQNSKVFQEQCKEIDNVVVTEIEKVDYCPLCKGEHRVHRCGQFLNYINKYREMVRSVRLCYNCLTAENVAKKC
uniref:Uncharacterized protein n=1 Tax=Glossina austeni TaxID=7395 RepID=A0A1A9VP76_GLOAU